MDDVITIRFTVAVLAADLSMPIVPLTAGLMMSRS